MTPEAQFNPDQTTQQWRETLRKPEVRLSERDLFQLASDIIELNKGVNDEYGETYLKDEPLVSGTRSGSISLSRDFAPDDSQSEIITVEADQGKFHHDYFELRHKMGDQEGFTTLWPKESVWSILTGDQVIEEGLDQVQLKPNQILSIAKRLWEAHERTAAQPQPMTA